MLVSSSFLSLWAITEKALPPMRQELEKKYEWGEEDEQRRKLFNIALHRATTIGKATSVLKHLSQTNRKQ